MIGVGVRVRHRPSGARASGYWELYWELYWECARVGEDVVSSVVREGPERPDG